MSSHLGATNDRVTRELQSASCWGTVLILFQLVQCFRNEGHIHARKRYRPLPFSSQTRGRPGTGITFRRSSDACYQCFRNWHRTHATKLAPDSSNATETGAISTLIPNTPYKSGPGLVKASGIGARSFPKPIIYSWPEFFLFVLWVAEGLFFPMSFFQALDAEIRISSDFQRALGKIEKKEKCENENLGEKI